jgi:hypothetical protein
MAEQVPTNITENTAIEQKTPAQIKAEGVSKYSYQNKRNEIGIARYR